MIPESYIVMGMFVLYIIYYIVMSFASKYYIENQSAGLGRWVNFTWMLIVLFVFAILISINTECVVGGNCRYMSVTVATLVVGVTLINMAWGIYHTIERDRQD